MSGVESENAICKVQVGESHYLQNLTVHVFNGCNYVNTNESTEIAEIDFFRPIFFIELQTHTQTRKGCIQPREI